MAGRQIDRRDGDSVPRLPFGYAAALMLDLRTLYNLTASFRSTRPKLPPTLPPPDLNSSCFYSVYDCFKRVANNAVNNR